MVNKNGLPDRSPRPAG